MTLRGWSLGGSRRGIVTSRAGGWWEAEWLSEDRMAELRAKGCRVVGGGRGHSKQKECGGQR